MQLVPGSVSVDRNFAVLDVRLQMQSNVVHCGCKSALLCYRTRVNDRTSNLLDATGRLNTLGRKLMSEEDIYLVLAADVRMLSQAQFVRVEVTCVDPE